MPQATSPLWVCCAVLLLGTESFAYKAVLHLGKSFPWYLPLVASSLAHHSTGWECWGMALSGILSLAAARRVYRLFNPRRRAGKLLPALPCSLCVSLSHGFCEQAVTGKYFHGCTGSLALPNPAVSAPIIIPNHTIYPQVCFCLLLWVPSRFWTGDRWQMWEKSVKKKGDPLQLRCQLSVTVAFQGWECVMALTLIILMIIHLQKHSKCTFIYIYLCNRKSLVLLPLAFVTQEWRAERNPCHPLSWHLFIISL